MRVAVLAFFVILLAVALASLVARARWRRVTPPLPGTAADTGVLHGEM